MVAKRKTGRNPEANQKRNMSHPYISNADTTEFSTSNIEFNLIIKKKKTLNLTAFMEVTKKKKFSHHTLVFF